MIPFWPFGGARKGDAKQHREQRGATMDEKDRAIARLDEEVATAEGIKREAHKRLECVVKAVHKTGEQLEATAGELARRIVSRE